MAALGELSCIPACVIDSRFVVRAWSVGLEKLTGRDAGDVVGKHCWTVLAIRDERGGEFCSPTCELGARALAGTIEHGRAVLIEREGREFEARMVTMPIECDGERGLAHVFVSNELVGAAAGPQLTPRQREILSLLDKGMSTKQIAQCLGISIHTARHHVQAILRRFDSPTQLHALHTAREQGLV